MFIYNYFKQILYILFTIFRALFIPCSFAAFAVLTLPHVATFMSCHHRPAARDREHVLNRHQKRLVRDSNEVTKTLFDFTKDAPTLNVKGGFIGKEIYDAAKISEFSKIPGKKTLIAMLMSAINGPARQLAATLQAYVDKKAAGFLPA